MHWSFPVPICLGMFKDIDLSRDIMSSFRQSKESRDQRMGDVDLNVFVLTTGYWPTYPSCEIQMPVEVVFSNSLLHTTEKGCREAVLIFWIFDERLLEPANQNPHPQDMHLVRPLPLRGSLAHGACGALFFVCCLFRLFRWHCCIFRVYFFFSVPQWPCNPPPGGGCRMGCQAKL